MLLATLALLAATPAAGAPEPQPPTPGGTLACQGEYADDVAALLPLAREIERQAASYTFCVRSVATYECPYYDADGALRNSRKRAVAHGTAFAYRQQASGTLLLTNEHVVQWPEVTDGTRRVEGIPAGCRRTSQTAAVVDSEADEYDRDDVRLSPVAAEPRLDVAVLRAGTPLPLMPWSLGRSAAVRERNAVVVRGFPLGAFRANSLGKVISAYDHDDYGHWDHDDFVIDALLSSGSSGSPVLAVSCRTGQLELVGIYHAAYARGAALNVVVAIDQVRDLMTTLRPERRPAGEARPLDAAARRAVREAADGEVDPFFGFGRLAAGVRARPDGSLLFEIYSPDFPSSPAPVLALLDLPPSAGATGFGELGAVFAGKTDAFRRLAPSSLDRDARVLADRILDALRRDARRGAEYRRALAEGEATKAQAARISRLRRELERSRAEREDLAATALDLADRLAASRSGAPVRRRDLLEPAPEDAPARSED